MTAYNVEWLTEACFGYTLTLQIGSMNLFKRLKNSKIILIDDDEWIRDSMMLFFEGEECYLRTFETAEEGLSAMNTTVFDIIIADYMLPGMTGLEFFKKIQRTCKNAIRILITAYGTDEIFFQAKQLGVHDIIQKPFRTENIEASLSRFIFGHSEKSS